MKELLAKLLPAVLSLPYGILLTRLFALRLAGAVGILAVFLTVNLISRGKTVGGADLKLASAFWFACGPFRGTAALLIALPAAAISEGVKKALRRKGNEKKENKCSYTTNGTGRRGRPENGGAEEGFPLVPYLTAGCLCAAAIPYLPV